MKDEPQIDAAPEGGRLTLSPDEIRGLASEIARERHPEREVSEEELVAVVAEVRDWIAGMNIQTLEEARQADAHMYMQGDWGGQIYLSIPARQIVCGMDELQTLLKHIDRREWGCNEGDGKSIGFLKALKDVGISGGMGGGQANESLWVHESLEDLKSDIEDVLRGKKASLLE